MHLYGSLSDRNDIDYPNPQRYEFGDVDGAGSLQSAPIGNDDISDVDKCMFVDVTSKKKYLLILVVWSTTVSEAIPVKFWVNAETPIGP
jgi:hypothetical protein